MQRFQILVFIVCLVFTYSCNNEKGQKQQKQQKANTSQVEATGPEIPGAPQELMVKLWNECTYLDYIFHNLPFSMSQDEQPSIRANLNYISTVPLGRIPSNCKPIGRQFFHIGGDIVAEANVYYDRDCKFYVFVDGEKPLYANVMSQEGDNFFSSMIAQAIQATQGAPGQ